jgi:hypothetical protein
LARFVFQSSNEVPVSKVKSPKEKKALSLKRDRRNTYGENAQASRKGIRRGKQRSHMEERRSVGKILTQLRKRSEESDAIEADALTRSSIANSRHKAFKKTPDSPLGDVIKQKLARRSNVLQIKAANSARTYTSYNIEDILDTPYDRALHKHGILFQLRGQIDPTGFQFGRHKKKSARFRRDLQVAKLWKDAILRDAPLLQGFFVEEPEWREKMLRWCDKTLSSASNSAKS